MEFGELGARLGWFFLGAVTIAALLAYFGRLVLRYVLAAELETYKQRIQMEGVMAMERLRAELRRNVPETDDRVSKLQDKQAEIIAELYKKMVFLRNAMAKMTGSGPEEAAGQDEKCDVVIAAGEQLRDYFDLHRIYLDEGLCRKIHSLQATFFDAWVKHSFAVAKDQYVRQGKGLSVETWKKFSDEVPRLLQDIEQDFRSMLGHRPGGR
ncbi:MAG TPA: hypothetical protein VFG71_07705 [Nitrospiraceae bacterium]|nr:hypothetical protein [Nitrospiraceae bacterium]